MGTKWARLAKIIEGRTDNGIKNHWNSIMRKKLDIYRVRLSVELEKNSEKERSKVITSILNQKARKGEELVNTSEEETQKFNKIELSSPEALEQKSGESDDMSFDHILKKLDQND